MFTWGQFNATSFTTLLLPFTFFWFFKLYFAAFQWIIIIRTWWMAFRTNEETNWFIEELRFICCFYGEKLAINCLGLQEVVSWVSSIRWIGQRWWVRSVVRQGSIRRCSIRCSNIWGSSVWRCNVWRSSIGWNDSRWWTNKRSRCVWRNEFSGWCKYRGGDRVIDRMCVVCWSKWSNVGWCDSSGSCCKACECNDLWEK